MKTLIYLLVLISIPAYSSIVGISTHPLNDEARVLSAEMTGFMSQRHEVGMGLRYTGEMARNRIMDFRVAGAQESRALSIGTGMDFALLEEDVYQPRLSLKPFMSYQKVNDVRENLVGVAPTMRKGLSLNGVEFFPYLAIPSGMKINNSNDKYVFSSSLTLGSSFNFPGAGSDKILLSLEANRDMGASSDYVGCLISWVWK
jgi:hypothetical protein